MHTEPTTNRNHNSPLMVPNPYPFFFKGCFIAMPISLLLWWGIIKLALLAGG